MRRVRLTEGQLHNVIRESVNNILNEISDELKAKAWAKANKLGRQDQADFFALANGSIDDKGVSHGGGFELDFNDKYARQNKYFRTFASKRPRHFDSKQREPALISREYSQRNPERYHEYTNFLTGGDTKLPYANNDYYYDEHDPYDYDSNLANRPAYQNAKSEWQKLMGFAQEG